MTENGTTTEGNAPESATCGLTFGQNLRTLRLARGIDTIQLSRLSGVSQPAISRFEAGLREPRLSTLLKLANGLGVRIGELIPDNLLTGNATEKETQ